MISTDVYGSSQATKWTRPAHPSTHWGRKQLLQLVSHRITQPEVIVDLGCGAGFLTHRVATVNKIGQVIGFDLSEPLLYEANRSFVDTPNLLLKTQDLSQSLPLHERSVDRFFSSMVLQNLWESEMRVMMYEVSRCLKDRGEAHFLTLHPDIWLHDFQLEFINYQKNLIQRWRGCQKDGFLIEGSVDDAGGGGKDVFMITHSYGLIASILQESSLVMTESVPLYIDQPTAERFYGINPNRVYPTQPIFWIFTVRKSSA